PRRLIGASESARKEPQGNPDGPKEVFLASERLRDSQSDSWWRFKKLSSLLGGSITDPSGERGSPGEATFWYNFVHTISGIPRRKNKKYLTPVLRALRGGRMAWPPHSDAGGAILTPIKEKIHASANCRVHEPAPQVQEP